MAFSETPKTAPELHAVTPELQMDDEVGSVQRFQQDNEVKT